MPFETSEVAVGATTWKLAPKLLILLMSGSSGTSSLGSETNSGCTGRWPENERETNGSQKSAPLHNTRYNQINYEAWSKTAAGICDGGRDRDCGRGSCGSGGSGGSTEYGVSRLIFQKM